MPTYLLRVLGGLDPEDSLAPVFVDIERDLEPGDVFPEGDESCRFRTSDGQPLEVEDGVQLRCLRWVESGYYGRMMVVDRV